jgi:5S rRNA maturation endonuclease (ribonuclease M5)
MLVKIFNRGNGAGKGPVQYCISEKVPLLDPDTGKKTGKFLIRKPIPFIVKGDADRTTMLIDSSENRWKYTSGVIAFADTDNPSESEQLAVIESFEKSFYAGLEPDQFDVLWTRHVHEGNVELHFVMPRLELTTGKALNIAPPGYETMMSAWRDTWNYSKAWASPDEPERAQLFKQTDHVLKIDKSNVRNGLSKSADPKRLIGEYLVTCIEAGTVKNRSDVVAMLIEAGLEINRQGTDYISVRPEPGAKPIRLKGVLYDERFETSFERSAAIRAELGISSEFGGPAESQDTGAGWRNPDADRVRVTEASAKLARFVAARTKYNAGHYRPRGQADRADVNRDSAASHSRDDRAGEPNNGGVDVGSGADSAAERRDQPDVRSYEQYSQNSFGTDNVSNQNTAVRPDERSAGPDKTSALDAQNSDTRDDLGSSGRLPDSVRRDLRMDDIPTVSATPKRSASSAESGRHSAENRPVDVAVLRVAGGPEGLRAAAAVKKPSWYDTIQIKIRGLYDRVRDAVIDRISAAFDAIRAGHETLVRSEFSHAGAASNLEQSVAENDIALGRAEQTEQRLVVVAAESHERIKRGIIMIQQRQGDELSLFKTQINLVEYAESVGYEIDARESSKSSSILRRDDDKIIVATDADGHGVYFSVRDDSDHGSIIDFVQKRTGLNLGQVRKALRPWVGGSPVTYTPKAPAPQRSKPAPTGADRRQVLAVWSKMQPTNGNHAYLTIEREIEPAIQADPRFVGMVRKDARGNAAFPHYDESGITGYELKNQAFTGFAAGGEKSLWHSSNVHTAPRLVIVESAIDALSHAELMHDTDAAYISVGGSMSDKQRDLLAQAIKNLQARGGKLIVATDSDPAGETLAQQIAALVPGISAQRQAPTRKDWNDDLKEKSLQSRLQHAKAGVRQARSRSAKDIGHGM